MSEGKDLCAFCRTPPIVSEEEEIERVNKLVDKGNAEACFLLLLLLAYPLIPRFAAK